MSSKRRVGCFAAMVGCQLCIAGTAATQGPAIGAQPDQTAEAPPAPKGKKSGEEEIIVTGSRLRRKDLTTPAPVTVINREQVLASGRVSIGDFLQTLPQQGNALNTSVNNGGNGSTRVSLRSLGAARTLVLLNGRRMVPGGNGADDSVDLNSIPSAAIEQIEVLRDGASAVYGSDAIGGVVNLITRKRMNGAEVSGVAGTSTHSDGTIYDLNALAGTSGERGNLLFTAGFYTQKPVMSGDRTFSARGLAYDASGSRTTTGLPGPYSQGSSTVPQGTVIISSAQAGIARPNPNNDPRIDFYNRLITMNPSRTVFIRDPNAAPGRLPNGDTAVCSAREPGQCYRPYATFASGVVDSRVGDGDGYNPAPENYLVTPQQRVSLYSLGDTQLGNNAGAYFEGSYVNRQSDQKRAAVLFMGDLAGVVVSKDSIYNPFGTDLGVVRRRLLEFGPRTFAQDIDTFRLVVGLDGTLPDDFGLMKRWFWDVSLNYGRSVGTEVMNGPLRGPAVQDAIGPSFRDANGVPHCGTPANPIDGCVPLDLFHGPGSIGADQIRNLTFTGTLRGINQMVTAQLNTAGELIRLFSDRPVGLAVGYEYRIVSGANIPDPITVAGETTGIKATITSGHYYVNEGYGELSIPIVNGLPGAHDVEGTAAARVFNYSTFGTDVTYKLGGRWRIIPDFTVRGTYSTGFRAPSIGDLFLGQADSFPNVTDPCRAARGPANCSAQGVLGNGDTVTQLRTRIGGNPHLAPETAKIYTVGVVFEPRFVKNFSMTADYYSVAVDKSIATIGANTILNGCYPTDPTVAPKYCELIHRDANNHIDNITNTTTNVGSDKTAGVDLAMNYALPTDLGRFGFLFDGTWLQKFDRTLADGTVVHGKGTFDIATTGGVYAPFKFIAGVRWSYRGVGAGVNMHFLSSFKECGDATGNFSGGGQCYANSSYQRRVAAYGTYDVFLSYNFRSSFGKTSIAAGINNVFDKDPSVIYNGFLAVSDPTAYDFMGRFGYVRVGQSF